MKSGLARRLGFQWFGRRGIHLAIFGTFTVVVFQNCTDVKLARLSENSAKVTGDLCLQPPENKTRYSKIAFMVDKSGSNGTTDPDKSRRATAIETFVNQYRNDPFYKWAFMYFQNDRADAYIKDANGAIFGTAQDVDTAMVQFRADADSNSTPYLSALGLLEEAIARDMRDHPDEDSTYNIFFISDGRPTDVAGCSSGDCPSILQAVGDVVLLDRSSVFLNTVYYYTTTIDGEAARGLEKMAEVGGGTYTSAGNGDPIIFNPVKTGERPEPWVMKGSKVVAFNLNAGFCRDGGVSADSDADGICDDDELYYNEVYAALIEKLYPGKKFDPQNRNSFHEDYSDTFVWKFDLTATGSGLPACSQNKPDQDFDLLNYCEELLLQDRANANGPETVWSDELRGNGGNAFPENFDSDGDLFLDFIELFTFRLENAIGGAVDYASKYTKIRGITLEQIMYEHRHFKFADVDRPSNYDIETAPAGIDDTTGQQCYNFRFDKVPTYRTSPVVMEQVSGLERLVHGENENLYLFYFIATPEDQRHGKGILYHQIQNIPTGVETIKDLKFKDFKSYKVPKTIQQRLTDFSHVKVPKELQPAE